MPDSSTNLSSAPKGATGRAATERPKVLYVAAEAHPLIKTGGLGDVAGALPLALKDQGIDVRVLLPAYEDILALLTPVVTGPSLGQLLPGFTASLLQSYLPGSDVPLWLVHCPDLFARNGSPYLRVDGLEWPDNHLRFAMLSRAAAMLGIAGGLIGWKPALVHANDWHAGLVPLYLRSWTGARPKTVFTIHNMAYQGLFPPEILQALAISPDYYNVSGIEFWGRISFLKAALLYADCITTVSPSYAGELSTAVGGHGLDGVLSRRGDRVIGIVNGIDDAVWDPARDHFIAHRYDATHLEEKAANTIALRAEFDLPADADRPVIGIVSRLAEQKGIDVALAAIPALLALGVDVVVLGTGDRALEGALVSAAEHYPGRIAVRIGFDDALAHRIIAGADMLLVPSRFEPCGLVQLYAQRYGTIPVVHAVGGLADTVHDYHDGFTFTALTPAQLVATVEKALNVHTDRLAWRRLQTQAMNKELGWSKCARHYQDLYEMLLTQRQE